MNYLWQYLVALVMIFLILSMVYIKVENLKLTKQLKRRKKRFILQGSFLVSLIISGCLVMVHPLNVTAATTIEDTLNIANNLQISPTVVEEPRAVPLEGIFKVPTGAQSEVVNKDTVIITKNATSQVGSIFSTGGNKFDLTKNMTSEMYMFIDGTADGIVFVMHDDFNRTQNYSGALGQSLGVYANGIGRDGGLASQIERSFAIEFDTYYNGDDANPFDKDVLKNDNYGHVAYAYPERLDNYTIASGIITGFKHYSPQYPKFRLGDGVWRKFSIDWQALDKNNIGTLTYQLDGLEPVEVRLDGRTFGTAKEVFWGFTGATGGESELAKVKFASVPGLVYYEDSLALLDRNNSVIDEGGLVKGDSEVTIKYNGTYSGGKQNLLTPVVDFELSPGQKYVANSLKVNGGLATPVVSGNKVSVPFADRSLLAPNVEITFKVKLEGLVSFDEPTVNSKVSATNFYQDLGLDRAYMIDSQAPTGKGNITVVNKGDTAPILNETDVTKFLASRQDDFTSQENIKVSLKSGQDLAALVSQTGPSQFILNLEDNVGNIGEVAIPLFVKNETDKINYNNKQLIKGQDFKKENTAYPKKKSERVGFFTAEATLEVWGLNSAGNLEQDLTALPPLNLSTLPKAGTIPAVGDYPLNYSYGTGVDKIDLTLTMTLIDETVVWGDAPWTYDEVTQTLKIKAGNLGESAVSPWNRDDKHKLDGTKIKTIEFTENVLAPENSSRLFSGSMIVGGNGAFHPSLIAVEKMIGLDKVDVSQVKNMSAMFYGLEKLPELDLIGWNTSLVTDMSAMFFNMRALTALDLNHLNTSKVALFNSTFGNTIKLAELKIEDIDTSSATNMSDMFVNRTEFKTNLRTVDLRKWDTGRVTDMSGMFRRTVLENIVGMAKLNTTNVTTMEMMFAEMQPFIEDDELVQDFSGLNTSSVTNMSYMFYNNIVTTLDISGWDTSSVTNMSGMFNFAIYLKKLDLSDFDTSGVTKMDDMFNFTMHLEELNLNNWNTSAVSSMVDMFDASGVRILTLSSEFEFVGKTLPNLNNIFPGETYTGLWQNVGTGTVESPKGKTTFTSEDFMKTYDGSKMADTYVWQPTVPTVRVIYFDQIGRPLKDEAGHEISDVVIEGKLNDFYDVSGPAYRIKIKGYELDDNQLPINPIGRFSSKETVVNYVYKKTNDDLKTKGPYKNNLSLTWVPKTFDLGKQRPVISGNIFDLKSASADKQWIVVNEGRADADLNYGKTWTVTAKMGVLTATDGTMIEGSKLLMNLNKVQKYEIGDQLNALNNDIVPLDPNIDPSSISAFAPAPDDIAIGDLKINANQELLTLIGDGKTEANVMAQTVLRSGAKRQREGFATKISDQKLLIPYITAQTLAKSNGKEFKTAITWTLARDIN